jgi:hypothetical protein
MPLKQSPSRSPAAAQERSFAGLTSNNSTKVKTGGSLLITLVGIAILTVVAVTSVMPKVAAMVGIGADRIPSTVATIRQNAFEAIAASGVRLERVPAEQISQAVSEMKLDAASQAVLMQQIKAGRVALAFVRLWDDQAEDGDVIQVASGGYSVAVSLTKMGSTIAIPLVGTPITITGQHDGGGGITAGMETSSGELFTPVVSTGQALRIPVL